MAEYKHKKKGLSLVEMLIAVILFGVMSMIGFKYYKNFFSTGDIVKKSQIGSLIDQAAQISNAYDIYQMQFGKIPDDEQNLTQTNVKILDKIPDGMPEVTGDTNASITWELNNTMPINSTSTTDDIAFVYPVADSDDGFRICQIFNNIMNQAKDLNATVPVTPNAGYTAINKTAFCYDEAGGAGAGTGGPYKIVFVKTIK